MAAKLTLAHLSDPHLPPLPVPRLAEWNLKRALGFLNWHRARKLQHSREVLARLLEDLTNEAPDHIAVTGDLVNLGLPIEHQSALAWLEAVGRSERVSVIPGNHDIYVDLGADPGVERWRAYMRSDDSLESFPTGGFPFVRQLGRAVLIGLNSAVPTPPFFASGRLGAAQLQALGRLLESHGASGLVRVVLIHHPPLPGMREARNALEDAGELAAVLERHGAELVLHGHNHRAMLTYVQGPARPVPVVGVPSASLARVHGRQTLARYNLYSIDASPAEPIVAVERGIETPDGPVVEISRRVLCPARQPGTVA